MRVPDCGRYCSGHHSCIAIGSVEQTLERSDLDLLYGSPK